MNATGGTWEIARPRAPLPGVADVTGYRSSGVAPGVHRGLPSPYLTFVLSLDGPIVAAWDLAEVVEGRAPGSQTVLGGLHTAPAFVERPVSECGVQLALHPLAARALLGLPAAELIGQNVSAEDVWGSDAGRVHEQMYDATTWEQRFAVLRKAFVRRAGDRHPLPRDDVVAAWRFLAASGGNATVGDVAGHVHLGNRQLTEVFRREVGLSPKRVGRLMRYSRLVRRLSGRAVAVPLATAAAEHGYADQAHLTREFVEFTGIPPTQWLAEELRFVQESGVESGTFWSHD